MNIVPMISERLMPNRNTLKRPQSSDVNLAPSPKNIRPNLGYSCIHYIWVDESNNFPSDNSPSASRSAELLAEKSDENAIISPPPTMSYTWIDESGDYSSGNSPSATHLAKKSDEDAIILVQPTLTPTIALIAPIERVAGIVLSPQASTLDTKRSALLINYFIEQKQQLLAGVAETSKVDKGIVDEEVKQLQQLLNVKTKKTIDTLSSRLIVDNHPVKNLDELICLFSTKTIEELQDFIVQNSQSGFGSQLKNTNMGQSTHSFFFNSLTALGYSAVLANRIIFKKSSRNSCQQLLECHDKIYTLLLNNLPDQYSCYKAIADIASQGGASKTLVALIELFPKLIELKFTGEQIVKIASNDSGSKTLAAIIKQIQTLMDLGLNISQIVKVSSHDSGSKTLEVLINKAQSLLDSGYSIDEIVNIASHNGGSKTLEALIEQTKILFDLGFSSENIVKIAANGGGSKTLDIVVKQTKNLVNLGFSIANIVKIAAIGGGSKTVAAVIEHFQVLRELGLTLKNIAKLSSRRGGSKNIEFIISNRNQIISAKVDPGKLVILNPKNRRQLQEYLNSSQLHPSESLTDELLSDFQEVPEHWAIAENSYLSPPVSPLRKQGIFSEAPDASPGSCEKDYPPECVGIRKWLLE